MRLPEDEKAEERTLRARRKSVSKIREKSGSGGKRKEQLKNKVKENNLRGKRKKWLEIIRI